MLNRRVVFENRKDKTRFMTTYTEGKTYEDSEMCIVIEKNVSEETARLLCDQTQENTIASFLGGLPEELRDPRTDALLSKIIRDGQ